MHYLHRISVVVIRVIVVFGFLVGVTLQRRTFFWRFLIIRSLLSKTGVCL
jgi:hypothetical protein